MGDVKNGADRVLKLFGTGSRVTTPDGPGIVKDVNFIVAEYNNKLYLDPPDIVVKLDKGPTRHYCMCALSLPKRPKTTQAMHSLFSDTWPPIESSVPEAADMMLRPDEDSAP